MKKFPSLIRLPKHKRFNFEPRYYDPVKEDIENRIAQIKSEMGEVEEGQYRSSIHGAFRRNQGSISSGSAGLIQLIVFIVLFGGFVGWLFYGDIILYALSAFIPLYFFLRLRKVI